MPTKANLLSAIQTVQVEILRLASSLTTDERNISGNAENWGPRDVLAHLGMGKRVLASDLAVIRRGETPAREERPEFSNQAIYILYSTRPWQEIATLIEESQTELMEQLQLFSEEELNATGRYPWLNGGALWRMIAGNAFVHSTVHLAQTAIQRGDQANARRIADLERSLGSTLDPSDSWQGMIWYNQGCYHAMLGEKEPALKDLEKGMRMVPNFVEFASQDTDLVSLHEDQDFLALLERVKQ
jgi:hypothetical protein